MLDHAVRLFGQRGFAGTSLQDVADAAGMTRPAIYHYFASKEQMLSRLVTEVTLGPVEELAVEVAELLVRRREV